MEMANCLRCKKLFSKFSVPICEECVKKDEELFQTVKEFLTVHPKSTILKISQETGATHKKITDWLREGRLELAERGEITCRHCGIGITTGTFCPTCLVEVSRQIDQAFSDKTKVSVPAKPLESDKEKKSGVIMHTRSSKQRN